MLLTDMVTIHIYTTRVSRRPARVSEAPSMCESVRGLASDPGESGKPF